LILKNIAINLLYNNLYKIIFKINSSEDAIIKRCKVFNYIYYFTLFLEIKIHLKMDDLTFQIKNLEFHLRQTSMLYDKCVSKALKNYLDHGESEFPRLIKPCEAFKLDLENLMKKYEDLNSSRLNN
jgi:hypothetical protein